MQLIVKTTTTFIGEIPWMVSNSTSYVSLSITSTKSDKPMHNMCITMYVVSYHIYNF